VSLLQLVEELVQHTEALALAELHQTLLAH
jgi:hypothetical protein